MTGSSPTSQPSPSPAASSQNARQSLVDLREAIDLKSQIDTQTTESQALLAQQISTLTKDVRKERLFNSENPFEDSSRFDFTGCDEFLTKFNNDKLAFLRALIQFLSKHDVEVNLELATWMQSPFKPKDIIDRYNALAQAEDEAWHDWWDEDRLNPENTTQNSPSITDWWEGFCMNLQSGSDDVNFDLEDIYDETIGKYTAAADGVSGKFYRLGALPNQPFLQFMTYTLQDVELIQKCAVYISKSGTSYLVQLTSNGSIEKYWETGRENLSWSNVTQGSDIQKDFNTYLNQGSQAEKIIEIRSYISDKQAEVTLAQSNQELGQPEFEADGSEHVSQSTQEQASTAPRALTPSQIRERIAILHEKEKANPSRLLSILTFIGIDKNLLFGALAMDASIPNNELDFTITSVMGAMFTVVLRRSSLPSFITGDSENGESSPNQPVDAPNTQVNNTPEVLSKSTNRNQNSIHSKKSTTFTIPENFVVSNNEAIYLAPGTKITLQQRQNITFYNNIAGGSGNRIGDRDLEGVDNQNGKVVTVKKPCLILHESIDQGTLGRNITIQGHAQYSLKENFTNFNFN